MAFIVNYANTHFHRIRRYKNELNESCVVESKDYRVQKVIRECSVRWLAFLWMQTRFLTFSFDSWTYVVVRFVDEHYEWFTCNAEVRKRNARLEKGSAMETIASFYLFYFQNAISWRNMETPSGQLHFKWWKNLVSNATLHTPQPTRSAVFLTPLKSLGWKKTNKHTTVWNHTKTKIRLSTQKYYWQHSVKSQKRLNSQFKFVK